MTPKQAHAIELRQQGKSYFEISRITDTPKSTLSYWLRNIKLTGKQRYVLQQRSKSAGAKVLIKRNRAQTAIALARSKAARLQAVGQIQALRDHEVFLCGISLYWAEGYKKGAYGSAWKCVDFANADPNMITFVMYFFRKYCKVPKKKFRIHLMLHDRSQENAEKKFWSRITGVPLKQFSATSFVISKSSQGKRTSKLPHGTVHIRIHDVSLFFQFIGWIEGLTKSVSKL
jgi:hypothetical protein